MTIVIVVLIFAFYFKSLMFAFDKGRDSAIDSINSIMKQSFNEAENLKRYIINEVKKEQSVVFENGKCEGFKEATKIIKTQIGEIAKNEQATDKTEETDTP